MTNRDLDTIEQALCECGHSHVLHFAMSLGAGCGAQIDKRHVTAGGSELWPCDCKGFVAALAATGEGGKG